MEYLKFLLLFHHHLLHHYLLALLGWNLDLSLRVHNWLLVLVLLKTNWNLTCSVQVVDWASFYLIRYHSTAMVWFDWSSLFTPWNLKRLTFNNISLILIEWIFCISAHLVNGIDILEITNLIKQLIHVFIRAGKYLRCFSHCFVCLRLLFV